MSLYRFNALQPVSRPTHVNRHPKLTPCRHAKLTLCEECSLGRAASRHLSDKRVGASRLDPRHEQRTVALTDFMQRLEPERILGKAF